MVVDIWRELWVAEEELFWKRNLPLMRANKMYRDMLVEDNLRGGKVLTEIDRGRRRGRS